MVTLKALMSVMGYTPMFDKILLDAPCSGSGVLARRADLRWSRKPGDLIQAQAKNQIDGK